MRVRLDIHASAWDQAGTGVEEMRTSAAGEAEERQGKLRLTYGENLSADDAGAALTRVTILAAAGKILMRREGEFSATMVFEPGQTRSGAYQTPFGEIPFSLGTIRAEAAGSAASGEMLLIYTLQMHGGEETQRRMRIRWEAEGPC